MTLFTGLPGNGKTLRMLWEVKAKADKENREVYYHNIKDLALPWHECDPEKWMDLPFGSIIVIDECQDVFPKKPNGATLPAHYSELAKHRHKGFDIFLITQHPTLIDNFVRQLVGQHYHSVRKFGMARSTIYEWSAANALPQSASSQKSAISHKFAYPKEAYTWYKSAEVHTVKRAIPMKIILAVIFIIAVISAGYYALDRYQSRGKRASADAGVVGAGSAGGLAPSNVPGAVPARLPLDPVADARAYVFAQTPRVAGLPQTSPKYDELTKPTRVPVPAACIQRGSVRSGGDVTCKCFSQQGTPLPVEFNMCVDFARNGFFQEFDPEKDRLAQERTQNGVQALSGRPDAPVAPERVASNVTMIPDIPYVSKIVGAPTNK